MSVTISTSGVTSKVNSFVDNQQTFPSVAALTGGGYAIAWVSQGKNGNFSDYSICLQQYDASGQALGAETVVNTFAGGQHVTPSVAGLSDGGYVVTYFSYGENAGYAQRFDASGAKVGSESLIASGAFHPIVTGLVGGGYVVGWLTGQSVPALHLQRYDASGVAQGGQIDLSTNVDAISTSAGFDLTALADGGFAAAWNQSAAAPTGDAVLVQRFSANGAAMSSAVVVGHLGYAAGAPRIAGFSNGDYVVEWSSSGLGTVAQKFDNAGVAVGGQITVAAAANFEMSLATRADGGFYATTFVNGVPSIQQVNPDGGLAGPPQPYSPATNAVVNADLAVLVSGRLVTTWQSDRVQYSNTEIYQQFSGDSRIDNQLTSAVETATGDSADDIFLAAPSALNSGDIIGGGGGHDTLILTGSGTADFAGVAMASVEQITGSSGDDLIVFHNTIPTGLTLLDGGGGHDVLQLDGAFDLSHLPALQGDWIIRAPVGSRQVYTVSGTFDPRLIDGSAAAVTVDASKVVITAQDRAALFGDGLDNLIQPGGWQFTDRSTGYEAGPISVVNSTLIGTQGGPAAASLSGGGYVIVWQSTQLGASQSDIFAQRFDAAGGRIGGEVQVNTFTGNSHVDVTVTGLTGGGYVVAWMSPAQDPGLAGVYAQAFDSTGARIGGEIQVPSALQNDQDWPSIVATPDGGFLIAWGSNATFNYNVQAQRFDADAHKVGGEIQLNSATLGDQFEPAIVALAGGATAAFWTDHNGSSADIRGRLFDASGQAMGADFLINTTTAGDQYQVTAAVLGDGRIVVGWLNRADALSKVQVVLQLFSASGVKIGGEFTGYASGAYDAIEPVLAAQADGGFTLALRADTQYSSASILVAQRFDASGATLGDQILLNAPETTNGGHPALALLNDGSLVTAWTTTKSNDAWVEQRLFTDFGAVTLSSGADAVHNPHPMLIATAPTDLGADDSIIGGAHFDRLELTTAGLLDIAHAAAFSGIDMIVGSNGDDTLVVSAPALQSVSWLAGGAGNDTITLASPGLLNLAAINVSGFEAVTGSTGDDIVRLTTGQLSGFQSVDGGGGRDRIDFSANSAAILFSLATTPNLHNFVDVTGTGLDDTIYGDANANVLDGGAGADTLAGGLGADLLTGGAGNDTFKDTALGLNSDTIADLSVGDRIQITDANAATFTFSLDGSVLTYTGGTVTIVGGVASGFHLQQSAAPQGVDLTLVKNPPTTLNNGLSGDFNGDGKDDLLWRSDAGQMSNWLGQANGGFVGNDANAFATVSTAWHIVGAGDFNGDGKSDILWRSDAGQMSNWLGQANGGFLGNDANALRTVSTDWHIVGTGDFNGDGKDDIVWRSDAGQMSDWLGQANGGFVGNDANAFRTVGTDWHIIGVGDFNGDHRDDILWRSDTGQMSNWLGQANGGFVGNDVNAFVAVPLDWHIVGVGDFNGDGRSDILWRSDAGLMSNWLGTASGGWAANDANALTSVSTDWVIAGVGDYNGDGRDDIMWRNPNGAMSNWLGKTNGGFQGNDANAYQVVDPSWHIQVSDLFTI